MSHDRDDSGFDADEARMLRSFFRDEAHDELEGITRRLLHASRAELDRAALQEMMRTTHTLKGSAATVGLSDVAACAHELESLFARLRAGTIGWSAATADALIEIVDTLRAVVDDADAPEAAADRIARMRQQMAALAALAARREPAATRAQTPPSRREGTPAGAQNREPAGAAARRAAPPDRAREPTDRPSAVAPSPGDAAPEPALAASDSGAIAIPTDAADAPADGSVAGRRRRDTTRVLRIDAARIDRLMDSVGELTFDRTRIDRRIGDLRRAVRELDATRRTLRDVAGALGERLGDDAAALADIEERLAAHVAALARSTSALADDAAALGETAGALQSGLSAVRMASARVLFERLSVSLREIAREAGKRIEVDTSGDDTEFDKLVADQVFAPILQILRNAVAHGIEPAEQRIAAGKPPVGRISLRARHQADAVWIDIADDGAGIDPDALRERFVALGLWTPQRARRATEAEVLRAMFEPGVSTRDETDALAGRGVGLDSVRETIARLGGDITVESTRGAGTTFSLRLPVTAAVSQALLFKIAGHVYAIPNVHVLDTVWIEASSPAMPDRLRLADGSVPLVVLQAVLGAPAPADARRVPAVVVDYAGKRLAVTCDRVIGPREIIVKSLGPLLSDLPLYAGGTISGSGKVQLIIDTAALVQLAHPDAPIDLPADRHPHPPAPDVPPPRVLVADDSRSVREAVSRMLAGAGYVVDVAEDGERALTMLRQTRYAALVTDIEMPRLDGFGLLEAMRRHPHLAQLPAIVISSRTTRPNRERAKQLGAARFIPKPVTRKRLVAALERLLRRAADVPPAGA